jgi:hypothetical protein
MTLPIIVVPLYPNVPNLPGVPQLLRNPLFPASPAPTLGTPAAQDSLWQASQMQAAWGIYDSTGTTLVVTPDSVLDFDNRNEWRVSNFPIQAGGFASYNKVTVPFEVSVRMSKGGSVSDRTAFLNQIKAIASDTNLYTILTPEQTYQNCNITRYEVSRRGASGAFFLTEVDVFFVQIIQVTAQYSNASQLTQNAQNPASVSYLSQGAVQPGTFNLGGQQPFILGTDPNTVFSTLGGGPGNVGGSMFPPSTNPLLTP